MSARENGEIIAYRKSVRQVETTEGDKVRITHSGVQWEVTLLAGGGLEVRLNEVEGAAPDLVIVPRVSNTVHLWPARRLS